VLVGRDRAARPLRVPTRTCVACRTARAKRDLVRVVRTPSGTVELDETGRANGRGAYLCRDAACWSAAASKRIIERALGVALDPAVKERLAAGPQSVGQPIESIPHTAAGEAAATTNTQGGARGEE